LSRFQTQHSKIKNHKNHILFRNTAHFRMIFLFTIIVLYWVIHSNIWCTFDTNISENAIIKNLRIRTHHPKNPDFGLAQSLGTSLIRICEHLNYDLIGFLTWILTSQISTIFDHESESRIRKLQFTIRKFNLQFRIRNLQLAIRDLRLTLITCTNAYVINIQLAFHELRIVLQTAN